MNIRRVFILLWKELFRGSRGFVLIMTIAAPLLITLIINLAIGNLFENKARLAVYDPGNSNLLEILQSFPQIRTIEANSPAVLAEIVSRGSADAGLILPKDLNNLIEQNEKINLSIYFWGESLAKNRTVILSTLFEAFNQAAAKEDLVNIRTELLGSNDNVPWSQRLLPLTVMIAIFLGGIMLPATSIILEKQERTILALKVTPVTIIDLLFAKGLTGALISFVMGIIIVMINRSWGNSPLFLTGLLAIGSTMAAEIGILLGILIKDMNTLFAVWKFGGIILFGPAIISMFPSIPQWLNYLFPTYYVIGPILDLGLNTADVWTAVHTGIAAGMVILFSIVIQSRFVYRLLEIEV